MGKVLLIGINGNVGRYVYEALVGMNQQIIGAVTSVEKSMGKYNEAELYEFDFLDQSTFSKALHKVDRVFLMRPPHLGNPSQMYPFIDEIQKRNIKLLVFLSLMGVENNPVPPHYKIEKYIQEAGIAYCHIRPGFFMQNISGVHGKEIKDDNIIFIPAGKSKCSFIDTKDIGYAVAKVLSEYEKHTYSTYTITGQEALDYFQVADVLTEVLNRNITYSNPSWFKFRQYMIHKRKLDKNMVNIMIMLYFMTRLGTASGIYSDYEKITGKKPRTFREFAFENKFAWL